MNQRRLEIDEGDPLVDRKPLDLREGGRVRRIEGVVAVDQSRNDDPDWRR